MIIFQILVLRSRVIEDLHFESGGGHGVIVAVMVAICGHADIDATVPSHINLIVQPQVEVAVFRRRPNPGTGFPRAQQQAVFHFPALLGRFADAVPQHRQPDRAVLVEQALQG